MADEQPTTDAFFGGRLVVYQDRDGYRFSIDAVLLAHQVTFRKADRRVVDLGTGVGILPLILAYRHAALSICGVEIQPALARKARENVQANDLADRIQILEVDLQSLNPRRLGYVADVVVSNPPYRQARSGRINPNRERAVARHEIAVTLEGLVRTVRRVLRTGGYFWSIYPAQRLPELIGTLQRFNIEPKFMRMVHSREDSEAKMVLTAAVKAATAGLAVGPPLIIYRDGKKYSEEVQRMLSPAGP
ncbi:MAG: tRNA1(Val) (adenine(37)-N6)-methyltransferase [Desulfobacterales bacterium]|nr:tRNA1(Val) (adenine(37)-N6)-methyltransferase [Desulfobacterales bacterium]